MEKTQKVLFIPLFFVVFILIFYNFFIFSCFNWGKIANATTPGEKYEIEYNGKFYTYYADKFSDKENLTTIQRKIKNDKENLEKTIKKLQGMGFSKEETIQYIFPETVQILNKVMSIINIQPKPENVVVVKNKCEILFVKGKDGVFVDKDDFYESVVSQIMHGKNVIKVSIKTKKYKSDENLKNKFQQKSCFSTNFSSSGEERKNNIKVALSKFDGVVLEEGEILSFNKTTGVRNAETGYMPAKIISGGTFVEGYGGGVCQVSTTLYNACLLAGLEILEVHNHSLPVSYIEPSFDAMVNSGSSDLVIRNNSSGKILITTSCENDICKVKIFGLKNKYKITRISEKTKIIPAEEDVVDYDYKKYGEFELEEGEQRRISYAKDGYFSNGYLNFYNEKGELVKTKKIRENMYGATKGVVIKRQN